MFKRAKVRVVNVSPYIHHDNKMVDPLNAFSKEMAKYKNKRKKTEADHAKMAEIEFKAGIYLDQDGDPCIPVKVLQGALQAAARVHRLGQKAKSGIWCTKDAKLLYDGPRKVDELMQNPDFVSREPKKLGQSGTVMRTRPIFKKFEAELEFQFNDAQLNEDEIQMMLKEFETSVGIGDEHPRCGRLHVLESQFTNVA